MTRSRQHAPRSNVPSPDLAITFLRSLAPPQRQEFVARMRQREFAAGVRTIVQQVSEASIVDAHPSDPALARSIAHRLATALAPDEPLLLQLALHALLGGAHEVRPRHAAVRSEPPGLRRADGTVPPS